MIRLDAHQHFWQYSPTEHTWMTASMGVLQRDYLPADLEPLLRSEAMDGSIVVQARQSIDETRWLLQLAKENSFIRGVVGWVDLRSPNVAGELDEFAANPHLVGVRHVLQDEPDDGFMLRPEFRRGIAQLARSGLVYDILIYPRHLPAAVELVRQFPSQPFVLDHIAKPLIAEGLLEPWASGIRELARYQNVACKVSGMITEARWQNWNPKDFYPYLDVVLESFGPERLMIGSDWPVCLLSGSYETAIGVVKEYAARLTSTERDALFGDTCERIYGVPAEAPQRMQSL
jgi:L-fuconolactonase